MDRQDLTQLLTEAMRGDADHHLLGGPIRPAKVKTRLLEAHPAEQSPDGSASLLNALAEMAGLATEQLSEDLWLLRGEDAFFVDCLNSRFWLLHSTASAATVQSLVRRHFLGSPKIDSAWLPAHQLSQLEGQRRWIKSSFSSAELQPENLGQQVPRRWRAQVEGEDPDEFLRLVHGTRYHASASLTAVGSVVCEEGGGRAEIAADYQGSFVSSGSTFELVAGVLWRSLDRYEAYIRQLENRFQLKTEESPDSGLVLEGDVAFIEFPHPIADLDAFVVNLFTCREPFRLWGVPREVVPGQWEANAVDLHVGHGLRLELTARWVRLLLSEDTCGNTLARLVANLQHRFDARTDLSMPVAV